MFQNVTGLLENIFHGQAPNLWPLKMDKSWFFFSD